MQENRLAQDLIKKYKWAGKIRFISASILFFFLLFLKFLGGYSYLNIPLVSLILVEALANQPYSFLLRRVNIFRFQFYQLLTDIIVISWLVYYLGGLEAKVVSIGYYVIILWAGLVSGVEAVLFATFFSAFFFSLIVSGEFLGFLPSIGFFGRSSSLGEAFSFLLGNICFLFAFGYFSAHSCRIIKFLERKKLIDSLKYTHKLLAVAHLTRGVSHDIINYLVSIRGYVQVLSDKIKNPPEELKRIEELEQKSRNLLSRLSHFSQQPQRDSKPLELNKVLRDSLNLVSPLARISKITFEKRFTEGLPLVKADREQLQEVFVFLILSSIERASKKGKIIIKTSYFSKENSLEVIFSDDIYVSKAYLKKITNFSFISEEGLLDLGIGIIYEILSRLRGKISVKTNLKGGLNFILRLPVEEKESSEKNTGY